MKTKVLMKRTLFDGHISQRSDNGYLSKNDLLSTGNNWRVLNGKPAFDYTGWLRTNSTQDFIAELEKQLEVKVINSGRGRNSVTWLHPYLFIDMALSISPKLKIEVYSWLYDELIKYRNFSGDSYKKMCGVLFNRTNSKTTFHKDITKLAKIIKIECSVSDWDTATEKQLILRDRIHENISLLADIMPKTKEAIRISIVKAKESIS